MGWCAIEHSYCKPVFTDDDQIQIKEGRHAVVEQHLGVGQFVANDLAIHPGGERFCLITGPNMAGKSTYLRQNALIVILAQMGGWVPATEARLGIVDRLYCRVGSSDNLARGESTFLIEMQEAAHILNTASRRSFVIVDELGRGTSTQDGMAIAYAVMQTLIERGSKTLFATHYHELAQTDTSRIQLLTLEVSESGGRIRFLRRVITGIANSSYGLNVARMARHLPPGPRPGPALPEAHFAGMTSEASRATSSRVSASMSLTRWRSAPRRRKCSPAFAHSRSSTPPNRCPPADPGAQGALIE